MEATVCLGYLDLCQGVPWTVSVQIAAQAFRGKGSLASAARSRPPGGQGRAAGHVYIVWWCAAELAPSATRQRRCGHRSNGLPRQSGVVAAASSPRPCGHRGRQAACGNGMRLRSGPCGASAGQQKGDADAGDATEHVAMQEGRGRGGRRGVRTRAETQKPINEAGDADAGDGEEDEALQVALHDSI